MVDAVSEEREVANSFAQRGSVCFLVDALGKPGYHQDGVRSEDLSYDGGSPYTLRSRLPRSDNGHGRMEFQNSGVSLNEQPLRGMGRVLSQSLRHFRWR